jgi:hypothetical protein
VELKARSKVFGDLVLVLAGNLQLAGAMSSL